MLESKQEVQYAIGCVDMLLGMFRENTSLINARQQLLERYKTLTAK